MNFPAEAAAEPVVLARPEQTRKVDPSFEDAFDELFAAAYRVSYRILGSRTEAEDIAQEACTRAYPRWRKIADYGTAWVSRVAGNLAVDAWRRQQLSPIEVTALPQDDHAEALVRADLDRALQTLPKRQRQVLVLRYLADQTEVATAKALGCSVGSVKRHSHRALAALRDSTTQTNPKR